MRRKEIPTVQVEKLPEENLPHIVRGYVVASKEEARVAVAADNLGWEYIYQKHFFGGRNLRGGQVLDFLFMTKPKATPIFIQNVYWRRTQESRLKVLDFELATRHIYNPPLELWTEDLGSIEAAEQTLTHHLGAP